MPIPAAIRTRPLGQGDEGVNVRRWQKLLRGKGFVVTADGIFGAKTEHATKVAQAWAGISVDGLVGPVTWKAVARKQRTPRPISKLRHVARPKRWRPKIIDARPGKAGYPRHPYKRWGRRFASELVAKLGHYTGGPASFLADAKFHVGTNYLDVGGAPALAYTLGVDKDGTLPVFNDWHDVTWHCDGGKNTVTLGTVFRGGAEGPNLAQRRTLAWLWRELEAGTFQPFPNEPAWPKLIVSTTHRHVKATSCPGEKGERFYRRISRRFAVAL